MDGIYDQATDMIYHNKKFSKINQARLLAFYSGLNYANYGD